MKHEARILNKGVFYLVNIVVITKGTSSFFNNGQKITKDEIFEDVVLTIGKQFQTDDEASLYVNGKEFKKLLAFVSKNEFTN